MSDDERVLVDPALTGTLVPRTVRMSAVLLVMWAALGLLWGVTYWWLIGYRFHIVWVTVAIYVVVGAIDVLVAWKLLALRRWARTIARGWAALGALGSGATLLGRGWLTRHPGTLAGTVILLGLTGSILYLLSSNSAESVFAKKGPLQQP
jgi:hypothetical protein